MLARGDGIPHLQKIVLLFAGDVEDFRFVARPLVEVEPFADAVGFAVTVSDFVEGFALGNRQDTSASEAAHLFAPLG